MHSITFGNLSRLEGAKNRAVLGYCGGGSQRAQHNKGEADPKRESPLKRLAFLELEQVYKQAKPFNHETKRHQCETGAIPGQQRSFSRKEHPRIIQVGHVRLPW